MADIKETLQLTLDPISLILSQFSDPLNLDQNTFNFSTDSYFMERGPRYDAYAQLRESILRSKRDIPTTDDEEYEIPRSEITPIVKKSVRFQGNFPSSGKKQGFSVLTKSVPDFSLAARKENRRPPENNVNRITRVEKSKTPPLAMSKTEKNYGSGSKSVNAVEKQSGRMMGRKSCASIEELKGLSMAAADAINGEKRGGKRSDALRKSTVLSSRYY